MPKVDASMNQNEMKDDVVTMECKAQIIAFFAHKGGVSKTTNVHHVGYMLAEKYNKRVLLVDADPQNNLTQTLCSKAKDDEDWRSGIERGDIYQCLKELHHGRKNGNYLEPANCIRLHKRRISQGSLYLLPGSLKLASLEPQITFAHNLTNPECFPIFHDVAGGFRALFLSTCSALDIDYCLVDMGPSIGELNKSLFWASDYFIIPCSPDSYCKTTMKTMQRTLPKWAKQQKRLAEITENDVMPINAVPPKFIGIVMSLFTVAGKNRKPIKDSQHWMDIIKRVVEQQLLPSLKDSKMIASDLPPENTLGEIPHFLSLMPIAQRAFAPVYDIPEDKYFNQTEDGDHIPMSKSEISRHKDRASFFFQKYDQITSHVIKITSN